VLRFELRASCLLGGTVLTFILVLLWEINFNAQWLKDTMDGKSKNYGWLWLAFDIYNLEQVT
jgi:hypothetical protein